MTENQERQIDDLFKIWKNIPKGKLVLIKDDEGNPSFHLQLGGKIDDCGLEQVIHRKTEITLLTNVISGSIM